MQEFNINEVATGTKLITEAGDDAEVVRVAKTEMGHTYVIAVVTFKGGDGAVSSQQYVTCAADGIPLNQHESSMRLYMKPMPGGRELRVYRRMYRLMGAKDVFNFVASLSPDLNGIPAPGGAIWVDEMRAETITVKE